MSANNTNSRGHVLFASYRTTKMAKRTIRGLGLHTTAAVAATLFFLCSAGPALAQGPGITCDSTSDWPCSFQMEAVELQKVPGVFRFQSRVSQAKLPLGEAQFATVVVKVLRGTDVLCMEEFERVTVRDSVLNLEIGRNMSCELDAVIAESSDLSFQICLGGSANCLRPLTLGTTPYSVKASYARQAQKAHNANVAGQAHYAHRLTADRDLFLRKELATGYFDFYTHAAGEVSEIYNAGEYAEHENGGWLQWTPVADPNAMSVHIAGKDQATDSVRELNKLVVAAHNTVTKGDLTVEERGAHVTGDSDITGDTWVKGLVLLGNDPANLAGWADGTTHGIDGELQVTESTTVDSGGIHVTGDSDVVGDTTVTGLLQLGHNPGALHGMTHGIDGALQVTDAVTVDAGGVHVTGASDVDGTLMVSDTLSVTSGGAQVTGASEVDGTLVVTENLAVTAGGAHVTGGLTLDGLSSLTTDGSNLHVNEAGAIGETRLHGTVRFMDKTVFFEEPITVPGVTPSLEGGPGIETTVDGGWMTASLDTAFTDGLYYRVSGENRDLVVDASKRIRFGGDAALGAGGGSEQLLLINPDGAYATTRVTGNAHVTGDLYLDDALLLQTSIGDWKKAVSREGAQGTVLALNKDEAFEGTVVYGPADFRGDVTMANMVMDNGTFKEDVSIAGTLGVGGDVVAGSNLRVDGTDLSFGEHAGRGDGGRAMVHEAGDLLRINFQNDFSGGTLVDGELAVGADFLVFGTDLSFGEHAERGDGGRALVHDWDDTLVINFGNDFAGGTIFAGNVGIGTGSAAPSRRLYIQNGEASDPGNPVHDEKDTKVVIEGGVAGAVSNYLEFLAPDNVSAGLVFSEGKAHENERGWLTYHTGSNQLSLGAAGNSMMFLGPNQVTIPMLGAIDLAFGDHDTGLDSHGDGDLRVFANGVDTMTFGPGRVGINDVTPEEAALTVRGSLYHSLNPLHYLSVSGVHSSMGGSIKLSIWAEDRIATTAFLAFSDARIKDVIGPTEGASDLETLRRIQVVDYRYLDTVARGDKVYKKVVAQQLEEVYPRAVEKGKDFIPDIYEKSVSTAYGAGEHRLTVTVGKDHGLAKGDWVRLIASDGMHEVDVVEVPSARSFTVSGFEKEAAEVFVFGKKVDDYRTVDYEALSMLNVSAVQELARRVEALETRVRELEQEREGVSVRPVSFEVPAGEPQCEPLPSSSQAY